METIENKAFAAHQEDRAKALKYHTPDSCWMDWYKKGYRKAEQEMKEKAIEVYKRNCRLYQPACLEGKERPCSGDCEYLKDFITQINKIDE